MPLLTNPQNTFPDATGKVLFPVCLTPAEFSAIMGAMHIAGDEQSATADMYSAYQAMQEALAFLDLPEDAACFPLCDIAERLSFNGQGYNLLGEIDNRCSTEYQYKHFCIEVADSLESTLGEPEAFYADILAKYAGFCAEFSQNYIQPFPTACDLVVAEVGTSPTWPELSAFLDGCGITVPPTYDWEHTLDLTAAQHSFVNWASTPYANIPDNRTRFSWSSGDGLVTTYGTPGGTGGSTQRHYLYGKRQFSARPIRRIVVTVDNPQSQDATCSLFLHNSGTFVDGGTSLTIPASTLHEIVANLSGSTADLFSIVIVGGSAQNASHPSIEVRSVQFRGDDTDPF